MQDTNNENTKPNPVNRRIEETVPSKAASVPQQTPDTAATQPMPVHPTADAGAVVYSDTPAKPVQKPKRRRWWFVLAGLLMILLFTGAGSWLGYQSALKMRQARQAEQRISLAKDHFMAGLVAQSNQQYEVAKQQFEYVIQQDPTFPGAEEKLREVLMAMSIKNTPTPAPTVAQPTLTPTPDLRPQEEIYAQALLQYAAKDWQGLFTSIDSLRRIDPNYRAVEIDGMTYMALRFRGIDKILLEANLEGGLYDLALAERFGQLDVDALGYRNWARLYLNGASFWEADWERVMLYFEEIYPHFPNMRDSSGMTALERYRIAAVNQGDRMMMDGDPCAAYELYQKSLNAVNDGAVVTKSDEAYLACYPPEPTATPTPLVTVTPTLGAVPPTQPVTDPQPTEGVPPTAAPTEAAATEPPAQPAPPLR